jgi:hypothetical protein
VHQREKRKGKGVLSDLRLTLGLPGRSAGRSRAGGDGIWWRQARVLWGRSGHRRRSRAPWLDCFDGEEEGDEVDLQGMPAEAGVVRNSEGKRRPDLGFWCVHGRESQREEERIRREREGGRGSYPLVGRWAAASISSGDRRSGKLHRATSSWRKKMMCILHITPWLLGKTWKF